MLKTGVLVVSLDRAFVYTLRNRSARHPGRHSHPSEQQTPAKQMSSLRKHVHSCCHLAVTSPWAPQIAHF